MELIHNELVYKIIGFAMEFHKTLGVVFLESVYENAIIFKMRLQHIIFQSQKKYPVNYKGKVIKDFICDLIVENKIVVELKAIKQLGDIERAQIINYLKVTGHQLGLIINFGEKSLNYERIILTN
jgi:GxxExxY protein|tara:strand:+ start:1619 stop:1993 length:375 start_codon:yes stop_codon:yes gene_type:complete